MVPLKTLLNSTLVTSYFSEDMMPFDFEEQRELTLKFIDI